MAVTWEVDSSRNLILKVDGEALATISGLNDSLVAQETPEPQSIENLSDYLTVEEAVAEGEGVSAKNGKITLKQAALGSETVTITDKADNYELALDGADENGKLDDTTAAAVAAAANKWTVSPVSDGVLSATYYEGGSVQSWTLDAEKGTITHTSAQELSATATISGLSPYLSAATLNGENSPITRTVTEDGGKTFTLAADALPEGGEVALKVSIDENSDYELELATAVPKFDATKGTPEVKFPDTPDGTASIVRTQSAGWTAGTDDDEGKLVYHPLTPKTLATISGLKEDANSGLSLSGTTVTVAKEALNNNEDANATITQGTDPDTDAQKQEIVYTFALPGGSQTGTTLGFENLNPYWTVAGTTATYYNGKKEGWTLDDASTISYTAEAPNELAEITNLKLELEAGNYDTIEGISLNTNTITLSQDVLTDDESKVTTLTQGTLIDGVTETSYALALATGIATTATPSDITLGDNDEGTVKINQTLEAYWTLADNTKVTFHEVGNQVLATISGLQTTATTEATGTEGEVGYTPADIVLDTTAKTVTLSKAAIGTMTTDATPAPCAVTLADGESSEYKLARGTDAVAPETTPSTFKLDEVTGESGQSKSVKVVGTRAAGYTLSDNDKTITYTAAVNEDIAVISNLKNNVKKDSTSGKIGTYTGEDNNFVEGITLDGDTITLKKAVLSVPSGGGDAAVLTPQTAATTYNLTYKLALYEDVDAPATAVTNQRPEDASVKSGGTLNIIGTLTEGWTLTNTNKAITYTPETYKILATISNLKDSASISTDGTGNINFNKTTGEITLKQAAFKDSTGVSLTTEIDSGGLEEGQTDSLKSSYKFKLANDVPAPGDEVVANTAKLGDFDSETGTLTIKGTLSAGWSLNEGGLGVTFTDTKANEVVATVKGLASTTLTTATKVDDETKAANITIDASNNSITLNKGTLTNKSVTVTTDTKTEFTLALHSDIDEDSNSKTGFEKVNYWTKPSSTSARYYSQVAEGWTLDTDGGSKEITYKEAEVGKLLATISNLSSNITLGKSTIAADDGKYYDVIGTGSGANFVAGVSVDEDDIILSKNVLGTDKDKLTSIVNTGENNFVLALNNTDSNADGYVPGQSDAEDKNIWEFGSTSKYKKVNLEYWTLEKEGTNAGKITYTPQKEKSTLATITGLNPGIGKNDVSAVDSEESDKNEDLGKFIITLNKNALNSKEVTITSTDYALALFNSSKILEQAKSVDAPTLANAGWNISGTTATYKADVTAAGYEAKSDGTGIIYTSAGTGKTLATVTGLKSGLSVSDDKTYIGVKDEYGHINTPGLEFSTESDKEKVIILKSDVLGTSNLKVTGTNYTIALDAAEVVAGTITTAQENGDPPDKDNIWTVSGTTATYKNIIPAYFTPESKTSITYTAQKDVATLATVTGLKSGLTVAEDKNSIIAGKDDDDNDITALSIVDGTKVTLKQEALTNTTVALAKGAGADKEYVLALDADVMQSDTTGVNTTAWVYGATTTYKNITQAFWTLETEGANNGKITYTAQKDGTTLATITGLKSTVGENDITLGEENSFDTGVKAITLKSSALNAKNVTLTGTGYGLVLDENVAAPTLSNKAWSISGTTAYYKANVTAAGYEKKDDGTGIVYTSTGNGKTLATITGLKSGLKVSSDKQSIGTGTGATYAAGLTFGTGNDAKKITLKSDVLGTSGLKVTGTNYTIALDGSDDDITTAKENGDAPDKDDIWTVSGTTATYKNIIPAYFTQASTTSITYTAQEDVKTLATVKNLASGLTVAADGDSVGKIVNGDYTALLELSDTEISVKRDALTTKSVTLTNGEGSTYTIALDDSEKNALAPSRLESANMTFVKNTTATTATADAVDLKGTMSAGWTNGTDTKAGKEITYTPQNSSYTFATITGLKSGLTSSNLNGANAGIKIKIDKDTSEISLDKRVLGKTTVAIDNDDYTLALTSAEEDSVNAVRQSEDEIKVWAKTNDTTAVFKRVTEAYYNVDENKIVFNDRADVDADGIIATISGLNKDSAVANDAIAGIEFSGDDSSGTFTIYKSVLGKNNATITNNDDTNYSFQLDTGSIATDSNKYWTIDGTTAKYVYNRTEGYRLDGNTINYYAKRDSSGTTADTKPVEVATITGLKSGLSTTTLKSGITVTEPVEKDQNAGIDAAAGQFRLSSSVLGTEATKIVLTTTSNYKLALTEDINGSASGQVGWTISDGVATLKSGFTTAGYDLNEAEKEITYTKASSTGATTTLATVKGLKSGTTVNADTFQIDGIVLGTVTNDGENDVFTAGNEGTTIQLSKKVLDTKVAVPVTIKNEGANTYGFALAEDVAVPEYTKKWTYSNKTATLVENLTAGYAIDTDAATLEDTENPVNHAVSYYAKDTITTKIAGIKSGTISEDKSEYEGITFEAEDAGEAEVNTEVTVAIPKKGTFVIADALRNAAAITLTNGSKATYAVALENEASYASSEDPYWEKSGTNTTAYYKVKTAAGYTQATDQKINYSANETTTTLATLKGLKKDVADVDGNLAGVTIAEEANPDGTTNITLSKEILTNTNVTVTEKAYVLKVAEDAEKKTADPYFTYNKSKGSATLNVGDTEYWEVKTKTTGEGQAAVTTPIDPRKITYTAAKPTVLATINGLSTKLEVSDGAIEGIDVSEFTSETVTVPASGSTPASTKTVKAGVFTLSEDVFNAKDVTVTVANDQKDNYKFTLAVEEDYSPVQGDNVWTADGKGTAKYQYTTTAGYTLDATATTFKYSKEATTVMATITGLDKSVKTADANGKIITAERIDGIAVTTDAVTEVKDASGNVTTAGVVGVIELSDSSILGNKVKLGTKDNYTFAVTDAIEAQKANPKWYLSGTTARYKSYITAGYSLDTGSKSVTKKTAETPDKDSNAIMTITGLKKGLKVTKDSDPLNEGGLIVNGTEVTLSEDVRGTTDIKLTNGIQTPADTATSTPAVYYTYKFDISNIETPQTQTPVWSFSGGTATLKQYSSAGFKPNDADNPTTLTYSKEGTPVVATVKGLNSKLKFTVDGEIASANDVDEHKSSTVNRKTVTTYTLKENATPAVTLANDVITLTADALTTKKVTLTLPKNSEDNYELALAGDVITSEGETTEWTVSGTTATYRTYKPTYYTLADEKTINYTKETNVTTYATVSGLKKDLDKDYLNGNASETIQALWSGNQDGGVLTLDKNVIGTAATIKITSKVKNKDTFILALDTTSTENKLTESTVSGTWGAADNGGKATMKGTISAGWSLAFGGKTATYLASDKTNQTIATITGLKSKLAAATINDATTGYTVALTDDMLNKKNVTITTTKGDDYTLSFDGTEPDLTTNSELVPPGTDALTWTNPSGTATLKGYVTTAGYTLAESGKSITYTKDNAATKEIVAKDEDGNVIKDENGKSEKVPVYKASANLVTVAGITKGELLSDPERGVVTVSGNDASGSKLTVNGGVFTVAIDDKYNDKSVVGSANADNLQINGSGVSVTGGKGDDYIDLGNGRNTFIYSNGDGNDVIKKFTVGTDTLQIKSGTVAVAQSGEDIIVKVGTGSIKLTSAAAEVGNKLTIINGKGTEVEYWVQNSAISNSNPLLADNNYNTNAAQLSEIVKPAEMQLTSYNFDSGLGLTKEDKFTAAVSYAKDK